MFQYHWLTLQCVGALCLGRRLETSWNEVVKPKFISIPSPVLIDCERGYQGGQGSLSEMLFRRHELRDGPAPLEPVPKNMKRYETACRLATHKILFLLVDSEAKDPLIDADLRLPCSNPVVDVLARGGIVLLGANPQSYFTAVGGDEKPL